MESIASKDWEKLVDCVRRGYGIELDSTPARQALRALREEDAGNSRSNHIDYQIVSDPGFAASRIVDRMNKEYRCERSESVRDFPSRGPVMIGDVRVWVREQASSDTFTLSVVEDPSKQWQIFYVPRHYLAGRWQPCS